MILRLANAHSSSHEITAKENEPTTTATTSRVTDTTNPYLSNAPVVGFVAIALRDLVNQSELESFVSIDPPVLAMPFAT